MTVGLFFALGHSSVVAIMCLIVVVASDYMKAHMTNFEKLGGVLGASISGTFLVILGLLNLILAVRLCRRWRGRDDDDEGHVHADGDDHGGHNHDNIVGFFTRCCPRLFDGIQQPWQMYPIGFLFGLGFDTSSEVGLLGLTAMSHDNVAQPFVLLLPALFMGGMCLVDTINGVFMAWAYGQALQTDADRLYFNLFLTTTSGVIALTIGALELLDVLATVENFTGFFWDFVGRINDNFEVVGIAVVAIFFVAMSSAFVGRCSARRRRQNRGEIENEQLAGRGGMAGGGCSPPAIAAEAKQTQSLRLLQYAQGGDFIDRSGV